MSQIGSPTMDLLDAKPAPMAVGFVHTLLPYHSGVECQVPGAEDTDWYIQYQFVFIT
jgi:hypothetical protein